MLARRMLLAARCVLQEDWRGCLCGLSLEFGVQRSRWQLSYANCRGEQLCPGGYRCRVREHHEASKAKEPGLCFISAQLRGSCNGTITHIHAADLRAVSI